MKIAIRVNQVAALGEGRLDDSGPLVRSPSPAELDPHCRRTIRDHHTTRGLLGGARSLTNGRVTLLAADAQIWPVDPHRWGADEVDYMRFDRDLAHEVDVAEREALVT